MKMTVKVYDDAGTCVSVHEARSDLSGPGAVVDALSRAYNAEVNAIAWCGPDNCPSTICGGPHHEVVTDLGTEILRVGQEPFGHPLAVPPAEESQR